MDERDLREVVEIYCQPERREVVETYTRPLPEVMRPHQPPERRRKSRKGLAVFLICLAVAAVIAGVSRWYNTGFFREDDGNYDPYFEDREADRGGEKITIPT